MIYIDKPQSKSPLEPKKFHQNKLDILKDPLKRKPYKGVDKANKKMI